MTPTNHRHTIGLIIPAHRHIAAATHPMIIVNLTTVTHHSFEDCLKKLFIGFLVAVYLLFSFFFVLCVFANCVEMN